MTSDLVSATAASPSTTATSETAVVGIENPLPKIDPITAVQDSIDGLALSLFEALRGVRDAVAPESLDAARTMQRPPPGSAAAGATSGGAFVEPNEEMENMKEDGVTASSKSSPTERLLNGLNIDYFPPRSFDLLDPDYDAFVLSYLGGCEYARALAEGFAALDYEEKEATTAAATVVRTYYAKGSATTTNNDKDIAMGDVGYEFRKKFDAGWFVGRVMEIRPLAANGCDRRCVYTDGDIEDLKLEDLEELARLDPDHHGGRLKKSPMARKNGNNRSPPGGGSGSGKGAVDVKIPQTQAEYARLLADEEHRRDVLTARALADDVLAKSALVDDLVARLPGMGRTRGVQMGRIGELIRDNRKATAEMRVAYANARERREEVRMALGGTTCLALGVEEDT